MSQLGEELNESAVSKIIFDAATCKRYTRGRFLGKGGFAKCYELIDVETKEVYAGKIVPKSILIKPHHREKLTQEITIHRSLRHNHVVGFHSFFDDKDNVYILLELCRRRSLTELHKRRCAITEPECRYFIHQVALACAYLHKSHVIHRDLKLGNLFLNDAMEIKIGDFGLATRLDYDGERKLTLCGTPNYIAPEVLSKKGHSYEVDSWSLGCIVYTLLVGKPPFETSSIRETYVRISRNDYRVPSGLSAPARSLIHRLLHPDPQCRPSMEDVLNDQFLLSGCIPVGLPTSCLTVAPRFHSFNSADVQYKPSADERLTSGSATNDADGVEHVVETADDNEHKRTAESIDQANNQLCDKIAVNEKAQRAVTDYRLSHLLDQLSAVIEQSSTDDEVNTNNDDAEDPAAVPIYWISKWVDYSDKYGIGYQLCDNSVGVLFNDSTRLLLASNAENMQYIERDETEHFHTLGAFPDRLTKKVTLLKYFRNYMSQHLLKAGADMARRHGDEMTRLPFLRTWFRTRSAIILHLSNGTLQINFFHDHTKVILCPLMAAVTYIDDTRESRTYRLSPIGEMGCGKALWTRLRYAHAMVRQMLNIKSSSKHPTRTQ